MPSGKWEGESYEARIERLAGWGFVPCWIADDWPMPEVPAWSEEESDDPNDQ